MPALLPLDCLLGGINFMHTLLIQTIGPLVVIGALELAAKTLSKKAAKEAAKAANSPKGLSVRVVLGVLFGALMLYRYQEFYQYAHMMAESSSRPQVNPNP